MNNPFDSAISKVVTDKLRPSLERAGALEVEEGFSDAYAPKIRLGGDALPFKDKSAISQKLSQRVLVKAQNVHDYYEAHWKEHNWGDLRSFTCVKLPYDEMVVSYDHGFFNPVEANGTKTVEKIDRHVDVVLRRVSREQFSYYLKPEIVVGFDPKLSRANQAELSDVVRVANPHEFVEARCHADTEEWPGRMFFMLDALGATITIGDYTFIYIRNPEETRKLTRFVDRWNKTLDEVVTDAFGKHASIALATVQFMNCKNVEVVDVGPTRQQRRRAERENERAPVSYKTLVIHPVGQKRRVIRQSDGTLAGDVALHICRGHFKDYRGGEGLGRHHGHGLWWWSPQLRGTSERRIEKDYEVTSE